MIKKLLLIVSIVVVIEMVYLLLNKCYATENTLDREDLTQLQWAINNEKNEYSINVPNWNTAKGNMKNEVIVAVIDSGIDYNHEDLKNVIYEFSKEEQKNLGCCKYGYNASSEDIKELEVLNDHATHVAGIIGAEWNHIGISGIASQVKIINIEHDGTTESIIRAYEFIKRAVEYGINIKIINNSWIGDGSELIINDLINELGELGILSVFAVGNSNVNLEKDMIWPSSVISQNPYTILVGAYGKNGEKAKFSNYSNLVVDIMAPGEDIVSLSNENKIQSGTSMSAPIISGIASVLLGNNENIKTAKELKTELLSHVKKVEKDFKCRVNGIPDLSISKEEYGPVIEQVEEKENKIIITGANFGEIGTIDIKHKNQELYKNEIQIKNIKWSNSKIEVDVDNLDGIYTVNIVKTNGKSCTYVKYKKNEEIIYENEHKGPNLKEMKQYLQVGMLEGYKDNLYYMPQTPLNEKSDYIEFYELFKYSIKNDMWEKLTSMPKPISASQGTIINGKIIILGLNRFIDEMEMYEYDIEKDIWKQINIEHIPKYSSLINVNGKLQLVGGIDEEGNYISTIYEYNIEKNEIKDAGIKSEGNFRFPKVIFANNIYYIYGIDEVKNSNVSSFIFERIKNGKIEILNEAFYKTQKSKLYDSTEVKAIQLHGTFVYVKEGLMYIGAISEDNKYDTYILKENEKEFKPYTKRVSEEKAFWPVATAYNKKVYVIARSWIEPGNIIFRSTAMETDEGTKSCKDTIKIVVFSTVFVVSIILIIFIKKCPIKKRPQ